MSSTIVSMAMVVALSCLLTVAMRLLCTKTPFKDASLSIQRVVIGVVFGLAAVASTHFGVKLDFAVLNIRDAFALIAALLFDPCAGIIAGLIGGIERFIAGTWFGVGSYTTVACSISTIIAGVVGALMSVFLFENRKPSLFYALAIAALVEVFHLLMVLITHMGDTLYAFSVVKLVAAPMIVSNATAVVLATVAVSALAGQYKGGFHRSERSERPISTTFQIWLFVFVAAMFALTLSFTFVAQTQVTTSDTQTMMRLNANDIANELAANKEQLAQAKQLLSEQATSSARSVANDVENAQQQGTLSNDFISELASFYNIYEIDVIGSDGLISYSTNPAYIGFDMSSGEQSRAFLVLLDGTQTDLVQDFQPISYDSSIDVMYAGHAIPGGFVQVGYDSTRISEYDSLANANSIIAGRRIGKSGFALLATDGTVTSGGSDYIGKSLSELGISQTAGEGDTFFSATVDGTPCYCMIRTIDSSDLVIAIPDSEVYSYRDIFAYAMAFTYILLFGIVFILIYQLVKSTIVKNLDKINSSLSRITQGGLDEVVDVRSSVEFASLSRDINTTVASLKHYIAEAEARIDAELEFARSIQLSALPAKEPFPDRTDFQLDATMRTAKEVGGDFYDYFFIDEKRLALVIADVSGKGIPAALFMMKSKTLVKSLASAGSLRPSEVLEMANRELCEGNEADMFVTAWVGILDVETGAMQCSNAGHEYPAIMRAGGNFEFLRDKHGFVLGGMDGVKYKDYDIQLGCGDTLFLYTDGVTEATDASNELFGEERLLAALDSTIGLVPDSTIAKVLEDIDGFVGKAPQFDDITMICLHILEGPDTEASMDSETLETAAKDEELERVQEFVDAIAQRGGADAKARNQIALVVEEVFVNIAHYAYGEGTGNCTIECSADGGVLKLRFIDSGIAYDPLAHADPDITAVAEDREIGGLGILLVRRLMDEASYQREDGKNILSLEKRIGS